MKTALQTQLIIVLIAIILAVNLQPSYGEKKPKLYFNQNFETKILNLLNASKTDLKPIDFPNSIFKTYAKQTDFKIVGNERLWSVSYVALDPKADYSILKNQADKKTIVIFPTFTSSAYSEPGFYTYYRKECDTKCLTISIKEKFVPQVTPITVQVLKLLDYSFITDVDVDKDPSILKKYDKVIVLHNEYVTKKEFDAITKHPNVIYLYPNALYAEVKTDYQKNTISLVRGHGYPLPEISNGFNWKFDNSKYEYTYNCKNAEFRKVNNGWMLDCYPTEDILINKKILTQLKK